MGQVTDPKRTQVLQVKHRDAVWASGGGVFTGFDRLDGVVVREGSVGAVKWVRNFNIFINFSGVLILFKFLDVSVISDEIISN